MCESERAEPNWRTCPEAPDFACLRRECEDGCIRQRPPKATELTFTYTNWRGETARRRVHPTAVQFLDGTEWHPEPGWFLMAFDLDKREHRTFALKDCDFRSHP